MVGKQQSTKHTHETKDRVTLKTGGELRWSGMVSSSCSTSDTRRVNLVMHEEMTGKSLRRVEHTRCHL